MRKHRIQIILPMVLVAWLSACNNSVEEVSRTDPKITPPPTPGVSVALSSELQSALALDGQLTFQLVVDDTPAQPMTLSDTSAKIDLTAQQMQGQHRFYVAAYYAIDPSAGSEILVAEATKESGDVRVVFTSDEWLTVSYDKDQSGVVDDAEQKVLDLDLDKKSNLAEILAGGNPKNPAPTFTSIGNAQVPEKQSQPGGLYAVYTANALSPRDNATLSYSLVEGANSDRFSIDAISGVLSFVDNNNGMTWPPYIPSGNNDFTVTIQVDDGTYTNALTLVIMITDVFNLDVTVGVKSLNFTWFTVPAAKYYKLLENPDGNSGFTEVAGAGNLQELNFFLPIILMDQVDAVKARYLVQAFATNNDLIKTSEELSITTSLLEAVGFVKAINAGNGDQFGTSVALSADGTTLAVGAPTESSGPTKGSVTGISTSATNNDCGQLNATNCQSDSGAVYLYRRDRGTSGVWDKNDLAIFIKAPITSEISFFGDSVSLSADGTTLAVGAALESSGSVPLVNGVVTGISSSAPSNDCGAVNINPVNCQASSGAVYLYQMDLGTSGVWDENDFAAFVKSPNARARDFFGLSVSLNSDGSILAVGAPWEDNGPLPQIGGKVQSISINAPNSDCDALISANCQREAGAVYVYTRNQGKPWSEGGLAVFVKAPFAGLNEWFGWSLSLSADGATLAVGSTRKDSGSLPPVNGVVTGISASAPSCGATSSVNCQLDSGAVYIYTQGLDRTWATGDLAAFVTAPNASSGSFFGRVVSLSADGSTLAVGADGESSGPIPSTDGNITGIRAVTSAPTCGTSNLGNCKANSGAVYIYTRSQGALWSEGVFNAFVKAPNAGENDGFGSSMSLSADGGTLAVGADEEDSGFLANGGSAGVSAAAPAKVCGTTGSGNCQNNSGAVYVYSKGQDGAWTTGGLNEFVKAPNIGENGFFGSEVSLSFDGTTLAVGSSGESSTVTGMGGGARAGGCVAISPETCRAASGAVYLY